MRKIIAISAFILTQCLIASTGQVPVKKYSHIPDSTKKEIDILIKEELKRALDSSFTK